MITKDLFDTVWKLVYIMKKIINIKSKNLRSYYHMI